MSEQTCPDCGKPRVTPDTQSSQDDCCWIGYASNMVAKPRCAAATIARLRAKVETLEAALSVADRMREALSRRASYPSRVVADAVDAYDRARGAVYDTSVTESRRGLRCSSRKDADVNQPKLPKRLYLERWPEGSENADTVHYDPTGYGIDMATKEQSRIYVYERVPVLRLAAERKRRQP